MYLQNSLFWTYAIIFFHQEHKSWTFGQLYYSDMLSKLYIFHFRVNNSTSESYSPPGVCSVDCFTYTATCITCKLWSNSRSATNKLGAGNYHQYLMAFWNAGFKWFKLSVSCISTVVSLTQQQSLCDVFIWCQDTVCVVNTIHLLCMCENTFNSAPCIDVSNFTG